jgi:hypothetical protein
MDPSSSQRRANIESLLGSLTGAAPSDGRIRYVCRLGDTLRSVAMRHPALKDTVLWKLLAEVNGMSAKLDEKGVPVAQLKRGLTVVIPSPEEIDAFYAKHSVGTGTGTKPTASTVDRQSSEAKRTVPPEPSTAPMRSTRVIPGFDSPVDPSSSVLAGIAPTVVTAKPAIEEVSTRNVITNLSESARIVTFGNQSANGAGFRARLEVLQNESFWLPVVSYEINDGISWRYEFNLTGSRKSVRIDLPTQAAKGMADNDLSTNWARYCEAFLEGKIARESL